MKEENTNQEQEIDLMELITMLLKRWYIIAASVIVVFSFVAIFAFVMQEDYYVAESTMIVRGQNEEYDSADFQFGTRFVSTYTEFAKSNTVLNEVRDRLDGDYTNQQLRNMMNIVGVSDTIIIRLEIQSSDPAEAALIANTIVDVMENEVRIFEGLDNIEQLDEAITPMNPAGPNRMLYLAIGVVLGGMIGVFGVFVIEFLDKTVKTTKDIENKLGLRTLGTIPEYNMDEEVTE